MGFYCLVYYSMPSCVHVSWWDYIVSYIVFYCVESLNISIACYQNHCWDLWVYCSWEDFQVHLLVWLSIVKIYTSLICISIYDSYMLVSITSCSCMIQYLWYLEKLVDYIVYGLYGTSCAKGGPHVNMWYWFMMVILWHERYIHDACLILKSCMLLHFTW